GRDGGGGAGDGRGATRAVECAREGGDRAAALEGRGAGDGVARDAGTGARARAVAADLSRGRGERIQTPGSPAAERELKRVQAKVGELTMKLEIVEWFLEKKGYGEELRKLKRSGEL